MEVNPGEPVGGTADFVCEGFGVEGGDIHDAIVTQRWV
jgi:hypothetical protein